MQQPFQASGEVDEPGSRIHGGYPHGADKDKEQDVLKGIKKLIDWLFLNGC